MSQMIFIFLLFIAAIIRGPLSLLLIILKNGSKFLKKRIDFERLNLHQEECRSFKRDLIVADYCFEVSSEGELEQVRPLIEFYLTKKKRIEILFASPSVEAKCLKLALEFKEQVRIMRLPLASFFPVDFLFFQSPWSWVSAPTIFFCRYDFFPELLSFKFLGKKLILLSATSKRPSWFKNKAHTFFSFIIAANETEAVYFRENYVNIKVMAFDFRVPRIFKRLEMASQTLNAVPELNTYLNFLDSKPPFQKLILGSAWESDLAIFKDEKYNEKYSDEWGAEILSGSIHLLIVPHKLDNESLLQLKKRIESLFKGMPVYEISKGHEFDAFLFYSKPGIVILNLSGVLCELYSKFSFAYVGGGYERSIHSVLEPFLSGCQVICGPKINRSTEYDFIHELAPSEVHLLDTSFYHLMKTIFFTPPNASLRANLKEEGRLLMESIIREIETC